MQTVTKKSVVESPSSKPATAREPDIASVPVPDTLAAFYVNLEPGLTQAEVTPARQQFGLLPVPPSAGPL